jgi:hypothetical protein
MNYKKVKKHRRYVLKKTSWRLEKFYLEESRLKKELENRII